ncbi:MAG: SpoIID/LytB domain protein [Firmicutes bacterium]|nr:SpoIID/LytB domain protein [Bacillota bacterium]
MKYAFYSILLPIALVMGFFVQTAQAEPLQSTIRVGILSNQENVLISADTKFEILNGETGQLLVHLAAGEKATISVKGKTLSINGKLTKAVKISVLTSKNNGEHYIEVNKKQYRGNIDIHITHGSAVLTIVNTLPIEQYLYGVIAKEMSPSWHFEALKAQAVAARTYALYNLNKHQNDDYDVCATTDCQIYDGRESEVTQVIKAVDNTSGQVIMAQGKVIPAYFHSSSGGYTENSENVWGTYESYLRGVVDYDQNSPLYKWEKKLTTNELTAAINKAGYTIGIIKAIELPPLTSKPMNTPERGVSGRVKVIQFIGSTGSAQLTGEQLRKILGLKSTLFDVSVMVPVEQAVDFGQSFITDKKEIHRISGRPNEIIVISGFGWGHGLGLSQWGAKAMAEQGPQGDSTYFKEILKHYYQGTTIKKVF